jgi:hypothetical protein
MPLQELDSQIANALKPMQVAKEKQLASSLGGDSKDKAIADAANKIAPAISLLSGEKGVDALMDRYHAAECTAYARSDDIRQSWLTLRGAELKTFKSETESYLSGIKDHDTRQKMLAAADAVNDPNNPPSGDPKNPRSAGEFLQAFFNASDAKDAQAMDVTADALAGMIDNATRSAYRDGLRTRTISAEEKNGCAQGPVKVSPSR